MFGIKRKLKKVGDRVNLHQRSIVNSSEVAVVFYKEAIFHKPTGTLLVNSKQHNLTNEVIRFSFISLGPARELTPALLATIFDQALESGFDPLSLVSYKGSTFSEDTTTPVNMIDITPEALVAMSAFKGKSMMVDINNEPVLTMEVLDASTGTNHLYKPTIAGVSPNVYYITPQFLDMVFEAVKAIGLIPGYVYPVSTDYKESISDSAEYLHTGPEKEQDDVNNTANRNELPSIFPVLPTHLRSLGVYLNADRTNLDRSITQKELANVSIPAVVRRRGEVVTNKNVVA